MSDLQLAKAGDRDALNRVLEQNVELIRRSAGAYRAAPIPFSAIYGEGLRLSVGAIKSYDESKGTAFTTHLTAHLRSLNRFVESNKRVDRVPENQYLRIGKVRAAKSVLEQRNRGREPTHHEVADYLGWSPQHVARIEKALGQRALAASGLDNVQNTRTADSADKEKAELLYYGWTPVKQLVYDYLIGAHGKERTSSVERIAEKAGVSTSKVYRVRNELATELK